MLKKNNFIAAHWKRMYFMLKTNSSYGILSWYVSQQFSILAFNIPPAAPIQHHWIPSELNIFITIRSPSAIYTLFFTLMTLTLPYNLKQLLCLCLLAVEYQKTSTVNLPYFDKSSCVGMCVCVFFCFCFVFLNIEIEPLDQKTLGYIYYSTAWSVCLMSLSGIHCTYLNSDMFLNRRVVAKNSLVPVVFQENLATSKEITNLNDWILHACVLNLKA